MPDLDLHDTLVVRARTSRRRRALRREVSGRRWAAEHGIPTPRIISSDARGSRLVTERVPDRSGSVPLPDVMMLARRIAAAPTPTFDDPPTSWRARRLTMPVRLGCVALLGVDPRDCLAARAEAVRLPSDATSHGDFHPGNVLLSARGAVVIDWEHLGPGYRHTDALRYLATQPVATSAPWVETLMAGEAASRRQEVLVCLRWIVLRTMLGKMQERLVGRVPDPVPSLRAAWRDWESLIAGLGDRVEW